MALGARPAEILRLVVGEGLGLAAAGTALGVAGAVALSGTLSSLLFGVSAMDARLYAVLAVALAAVAVVASYVPARRAAQRGPDGGS